MGLESGKYNFKLLIGQARLKFFLYTDRQIVREERNPMGIILSYSNFERPYIYWTWDRNGFI